MILAIALLCAVSLAAQVPQARILVEEGRYAEAKRLLAPLTKDAEALHLLSRIAMLHADDEAAADFCRKAAQLQPANAEYHYCVGNAVRSVVQHASIFKKPALSKEAVQELGRAVELDPNHLPARFALLDYNLYAPAIAGGSEAKALEQAAEIRKRDALMGHRAYARIYSRQKKPDLARKELIDAVREDPKSARAHVALASFYANEDKNYKAAFDELETAIRLDAAYMPAWFHLGYTAATSSSNLARGEEALRKYLAYRPKPGEPAHAGAWYALGLIQEKAGRRAEARQSYAAAVRLNPGSEEMKKALKRVQ